MALIIVRTLIIYFTLLAMMRLMGKRQLGEMELSEFVVAALIADLAAIPLQDIGTPLLNGLLPILLLFCCEVIISGVTLKNIRLRSAFFGKPSLLIVRGKINQTEMRKNRFTLDELMQELRNQGNTDISQIEYAILETDGRLNVLLYPAERPATASLLGLDAGPGGYPVIVVSDGRILDANLRHAGRDRAWLSKQLSDRGLTDARQVYLLTVNEAGQVYFAPREGTEGGKK